MTFEPAWHPDPLDANRLRWWDGGQWTDQLHVSGTATVDTLRRFDAPAPQSNSPQTRPTVPSAPLAASSSGPPTPPQPSWSAAPPPEYGTGRTNGLAVASLVLGIVWLYWLGSILAVVFGHIARGQIRRTGDSGDGLAVAGLVLGYIGVAVLVIGIIGLSQAANDF